MDVVMCLWLQPGVALRKMRPYSVALCALWSSRHSTGSAPTTELIGYAHSDPYLSTATPLATTNLDAPPVDMQKLLEEIPPVGLIVLCSIPALDATSSCIQSISARQSLGDSILQSGALAERGLRCCWWDCDLGADDVLHHCLTSDLWETIRSELFLDRANGGDDHDPMRMPLPLPPAPHHAAAIALQHLLDEEMGGWPNTFG